MADEDRPVRRVVTGHDPAGTSIVLSDQELPAVRRRPAAGVTFYEVWATAASPAPITAGAPDPTRREVFVSPPAGGTVVRVCEFLPGFVRAGGERLLTTETARGSMQSPMHRTESVDYGIVLTGEITLVLDDDSEVVLRAGDIAVQRGTDHSWANRGTEPARVAFVLVDGEFTEELAATLPDGARDRVLPRPPLDDIPG
jgi:mannose-6-phosphate isomerase-like protein (cupin superfamily)